MLVSELSVIHVSIVQMEMCGIFQMELMKQLLFSRMLEVSRIKHCALTGRRDWLRRRKQLKLRFGSVVPISGSDFVREVSQAPSDVWVVVILYKDGALKNLSQDIL
ncbi:phosducin-like protein 3 [Arachis ipaensis]|uniref:phosducin-like protein 3 n=1 Tax=Arachis ipaensis TaxID=130454 RepID=UPI0007AF073F|nr:phosducin-like protein 3 [Arachis ipaensis]